VALVKIAFAGAPLDQSDGVHPTGTVAEPTVAVVDGSVTNTVNIEASVVANPAVTVKSTATGTVAKLLVATGDQVAPGTALLTVTQVEEITRSTGEVTTKKTTKTVTATAAGVVTVNVLKDQAIAVGDDVASINPGTLSVQGQLTPDQQYRLINAPSEASVTLKGGPAPFTCTGVTIGAAPSSGTQADGASQTSTGTISCGIPAEVTAFVGLGADLSISNGTATGAVVPITAVQGTVQKGNVWVVTDSAEPEQRSVGLGLTDGSMIVITEGLQVGDSVLQFTPVASDDPIDCTQMPDMPSDAWFAECGG
jgi:biotin carboxyl carrier protein